MKGRKDLIQISRLIGLPLLKQEKKLELSDYSIDNIIQIQKQINTRPKIDIARFKKGKEYFIDYSNKVSNYLNNNNYSNELKLENLKLIIKNENNNSDIPKLQELSSTIENTIYETTDTKVNRIDKFLIHNKKAKLILKDKDKNNINNINNINNKREILFRTHNFIKEISNYNSELSNNNYNLYSFKKNSDFLIVDNLYLNLQAWFKKMSSVIGKPVLLIKHNKIKILIGFFWTPYNEYNLNLESKYYSKFLIYNKERLSKLSISLSKYFNKPVELELIRIHLPFMDGNILVNLFGLIVNVEKWSKFRNYIFTMGTIIKDTKFQIRTNQIDPIIPSVISGIKLRFAGRFITQKYFRRVRNKEIQRGALNRSSSQLTKLNRYTNKNRRGAFSISITTGYSILN